MVYIKRDKNGKICAVYSQAMDDVVEKIDTDSPEFLDFLTSCNIKARSKFMRLDMQMARVLEDVIDILMDKNILTITDFPQPVIEKLLARQSFRKRYSGVAGMEYDDHDTT